MSDEKPCCSHPVERHAYNGCADCGCGLRWDEHPNRDMDTSYSCLAERFVLMERRAIAAESRLVEVEGLLAKAQGWIYAGDYALDSVHEEAETLRDRIDAALDRTERGWEGKP